MKTILIILLSLFIPRENTEDYSFSCIQLFTDDNEILEDDFNNKYLVNVRGYNDTMFCESRNKSLDKRYYYYNNKNYSLSKIYDKSLNYIIFYTQGNIFRISFYNKETQTEMNIFLRLNFYISSNNSIYRMVIKGISFQEGNYLYDMLDNNQYHLNILENKQKKNPLNMTQPDSRIELKNFKKHKISEQNLRAILPKYKQGCEKEE